MKTRIEASAYIEEDVSIGRGCYIGHCSQIRPGVVIGENSEIRAFCFVAPGAQIARHVKIMQYSNICEGAIIGEYSFIGVAVCLTNTRNIRHVREIPLCKEPPIIGRGVRIGSGALILPGITIGDNAMIAAGSVVSHDVPEGSRFRGLPARCVGFVPEDELL